MGCSDKYRVTINLINKIFEAGSKSMDKNEWRTPPELFKKYNDIYHFDWDLAATKENALAPKFFTKEDDALSKDWTELRGCNCWLNPPYSGKKVLDDWTGKTVVDAGWIGNHTDSWIRFVLLVPSRTGTDWFEGLWRRYKNNRSNVHIDFDFIRGRVAFLNEDNEPCKGNPENSIVVTITGKRLIVQSPL